jgi:hypothetical protein
MSAPVPPPAQWWHPAGRRRGSHRRRVAGGGGGLIGAAFARFLEQRHAHRLQEQLDRGGLVLWVRTPAGG